MIDVRKLKTAFISLFFIMCTACSDNGDYYNYLKKTYAEPDKIDAGIFYSKANDFWMVRVDTLNENSYRQNDTLKLFLEIQEILRNSQRYDPQRFAEEIQDFIDYDAENSLLENPVLFVGSSTVNLWKTGDCFPGHNVINRGFGGASIKDILYYYNDVIWKYNPSSIIIYNDIDIENGVPVDSVLGDYIVLSDRIHHDFPESRIIIISIKSTPMDFLLGIEVRNNKIMLNKKLKEYADEVSYIEYLDLETLLYNPEGALDLQYYSEDRMHLNENGYLLWSKELEKII